MKTVALFRKKKADGYDTRFCQYSWIARLKSCHPISGTKIIASAIMNIPRPRTVSLLKSQNIAQRFREEETPINKPSTASTKAPHFLNVKKMTSAAPDCKQKAFDDDKRRIAAASKR